MAGGQTKKTYKGRNLSLLLPLIYSSNFPLFFKKTFYFEKTCLHAEIYLN